MAPGRNALLSAIVSIPFFFVYTSPLHAATSRGGRDDGELRKALIGTWEMDIPTRHFPFTKVFATFQANGAFETLVIANISGFDGSMEVKGRWSLVDGLLIQQVTKATAPALVGTVHKDKIISLDQMRLKLRGRDGIEQLRRGRRPAKSPPVSKWLLALIQDAGKIKSFGLHTPTPSYPYSAAANRTEGHGIFRLIIDESGGVGSVEIVQSTGTWLLDQTAIETLKRWRFQRGTLKDLVTLVTFTLH